MSYDYEQFYPTPNYLAIKMARLLPKKAGKILEPSAGDGSLIRAIEVAERKSLAYVKWYEIDKTKHGHLNRLSRYGKLGEDFLQSDHDQEFDAVIMNPPFNRGEDHILKAYTALKKGGTLVCLISSATLNGKTVKESKINKILELENAELENLEDVFSRSEAKRKTGVQCTLIKLVKTYGENEQKTNIDDDLEKDFNPLSTISLNTKEAKAKVYNYIHTLVDNYNRTLEEHQKAYLACQKLQQVRMSFIDNDILPKISDPDSFKQHLTREFWNELFKKTELRNYMTTTEQQLFSEKQNKQNSVKFNQENIAKLMINLIQESGDIITRSCRHIFNCITSNHYHSNKFEGWKTNKHDKVDKKLIIPDVVDYTYGQSFNYRKEEYLCDIEKTLCLLIGKKFSEISPNYKSTIHHSLYYAETGVWHDSYFFKCKVFKKGTVHLTWKNEQLRQKFNQVACNGYNNLGGDF